MDTLMLVAIAVGLCLLLIGATWLAWLNRSSSSLGLATGTLWAAAVLWLVQALFELQPSTERDYIPISITVNAADFTFTGPHKGRLPVDREQFPDAARYVTENLIAQTLRELKVPEVASDPERAADDYVLFNLVAYMTAANADWQGQRVSYGGATRREAFIPLSRGGEFAAYSRDQLRGLLASAGNLLAQVPLPSTVQEGLRLPPSSQLRLGPKSLTVINPVFTLTFAVKMPGEEDPACCVTGTGFERDGVTYLSLWRGLDVEVKYAGLRSHTARDAEFRKWLKQTIDGARRWFATAEPTDGIVQLGP